MVGSYTQIGTCVMLGNDHGSMLGNDVC